jgi:putative lipoic acid-binding regulatory protein
MDATIPEDENTRNINKVLKQLEIPNEQRGRRLSKNGRYMSFTYTVTINKHSILKALYRDLKSLPGIKLAI